MGVVHRNIKPSKIMITDEDNQIKIVDFGVSKKIVNEGGVKSDRRLKQVDVLQSPEWSAPEVFSGIYDSKSDMWSLGALLYTLISGH